MAFLIELERPRAPNDEIGPFRAQVSSLRKAAIFFSETAHLAQDAL